MYRIALVSMPFAAADIPSIALAQLKSVVTRKHGDRVSCDIFYLNLDLVNYLGLPLYQMISQSVEANTAGLGDWFFSGDAFPGLPDPSELYLGRHFAEQRTQFASVKPQLLAKRQNIGRFLQGLIDRYRLFDYQLVGLTSMFSQNMASFALAKRLKEKRPETLIVMGGANCEAPMGAVIVKHVQPVDFVFSGPALRTFPRFVGHVLDGEMESCHQIPGVLSRHKVAQMPISQCREIGEELSIDEKLPLDYEDYFKALGSKIRGSQLKPRLPFETSRGCWWGERSHCTFCGLNGATMSYRAMEPNLAVEHLQDLFDRYGSRVEEFESVDNILPREYLTEVLPRLSPPGNTSLFYEIKADLKVHEMAVLAKARVSRIQPGIEALSTSTLKLMKKGTTAFQNLQFLMHCHRFGITPNWNLLVGFPGEPESVYEKYCKDIPLLTHLYPPGGVFPIRFDRFSPYHKLAAEYGLKLHPSDFYSMIYPFPKEDLYDLAYFFRDEDLNAPYLVNTSRWLGRLRERVAQWWALWERSSKPELLFEESGGDTIVSDSRSGSRVEHRISPSAERVLRTLRQHHKIPRLAEVLGDLSIEEVTREVAALRELGLLFEENGLYLSLVLQPGEQEDLSPVTESGRTLSYA
jgi:magnesium-protoporphyrin IX monomethyl ester (oxidative) cyclase